MNKNTGGRQKLGERSLTSIEKDFVQEKQPSRALLETLQKIMDENNQIIKLVNEGMKMEREGKIERAQELFIKAWETSSDDHEKCIAAHFIARHQNNPEDTLRWNMESLNRANDVSQEKIKSYYPSLCLNVGTSHEDLGNYAEAGKYYNLAFEKISDLPTDKDNAQYSKDVRETILERRSGLIRKIK